ncbi:odorant binding protein 12 [Halictus rubicundus]|uniref:odorant binding protein 12 n=1 Tax=Halictus rubicundus TaxID=77578 RepID=UPI00403508CE
MKYFSVLLCLFLCYELSTQEPMRPFHGRKRSKGFFDECLEHFGVPRGELANIRNFDEVTAQLKKGEDDLRNVGCFLACLYQEHDLMTGNTFVRHPLSEDDNDYHFEQIRDGCMDSAEGAGDECDVALAFKECMEASWTTPAPLS